MARKKGLVAWGFTSGIGLVIVVLVLNTGILGRATPRIVEHCASLAIFAWFLIQSRRGAFEDPPTHALPRSNV
ncbi:MAG: hypothetical protein WCA16_19825 [Candidatus Sulfotelmatobacter sp.]